MSAPVPILRIPGATELDRLVERSAHRWRSILSCPWRWKYLNQDSRTRSSRPGARCPTDQVGRTEVDPVQTASQDSSSTTSCHCVIVKPCRTRRWSLTWPTVVEPGSRRPSIETLLHAFLPTARRSVHADVICALTNNAEPARHVRAALGDDVAVVPYVRPGFDLSRRVAALAGARAVVLAKHGLVTWGDTHEASYGLTLALLRRPSRIWRDAFHRKRIRASLICRTPSGDDCCPLYVAASPVSSGASSR